VPPGAHPPGARDDTTPSDRSSRAHARRRGFAALAATLALSALSAPAAARAGSGQLQIIAMTYHLFQGL